MFKVSDNPSLSSDLTAILSKDSVTIPLVSGISLNHLIPTISFSGRSISPESGVAQDFTRPITYTITAEDGTTDRVTFTAMDSATTLTAHWHLLKDSVWDDSFFVNPGGGHNVPGRYFGTDSDYYEFTSIGILKIHEGNGIIVDDIHYQLLPNNKLSVEGWDALYGRATIETLTFNSAIFSWETWDDYGSRFFRRLTLTK